MKITMNASSFYNVSFQESKEIEVDDDEWNEMDENERHGYMDEEVQNWLNELVDVDWKIDS